MGVNKLWSLLEPTSKAVLMESIAGSKLAIDASIWLYQFLKAMRDTDGNPIRGAHIVGFLRRICKLLFYGIKPIFVFDGETPALKLATLQARNQRKQKAGDNLERTANRLLQAQMKLAAMDQMKKPFFDPSLNKQIKLTTDATTDEYRLPSKPTRDDQRDARYATETEIYDFIANAKNKIDLQKININSAHFQTLPIEMQHEIILDLKNNSREPNQQRVLDMVENSKTALDFSKQQINNLIHRATLMERYNTTLKGDGVKKRVADARIGGWDLHVKPKNVVKVVESLDGMQGFSKTLQKKSKITIEDYINEDSDEDYQLGEEFKAKQVSSLRKYLSTIDDDNLYSKSQEYLNSDDWLQNWVAFIPKNIESISIGTSELFSPSTLLKSKEEIEAMLKLYTKKHGKCSQEAELEKYQYVITFLEAVLARMRSVAEKPLIHVTKKAKFDPELICIDDEEEPKRELVNDKEIFKGNQIVKVGSSKMNRDTEKTSLYFDSESDQEELGEFQNPFILKTDTCGLPISNFRNSVLDTDVESERISTPEVTITESSYEKANIDDNAAFTVQAESTNSHPIAAEDSKSLELVEKAVIVEHIDLSDESSHDEMDWENIEIEKVVETKELNAEVVVTDSPTENERPKEVIAIESAESLDLLSSTNIESQREHQQLSDNEIVEISEDDEPALYDAETQQFLADLSSGKDLQEQIKKIQEQVVHLTDQFRAENRVAGDIDSSMIYETQELLKIFGCPFINAPMEAESQCAFLLSNKLVDGIVTDDSDVFLFGGTKVYRNMFQSQKFVEAYTMEGIKGLDLERHHLIQMALLLGSDYTPGIKGIGPVSSIEIITSWPSDDLSGLKEFKQWVLNLQKGITDKEDTKIQVKLRTLCKKIELPNSFPDENIFKAYTDPRVDSSLQEFQWGEPNLDKVRDYLNKKLNWPKEKVDPIIIPVIKEMRSSKASRQTTLDSFVQSSSPIKHKSARVNIAIRARGRRRRGN
ncbi:DNA repair protein rad2 [Boothiomyces sp. JEL0866]|nr:DNA repair protein rad2 [Boothiomyces sp. JEL0866]